MATKIKSIEKKRMYKIIADELINYIISNNLQPGDTLLSENELSSLFNVSRTSVREGIIHLETLGIVSTNNKQGIVINETNFKTVTDHLIFGFKKDEIEWKGLLDARKILELGALELAIDNLNDEHFRRMEQVIQRSKDKLEQKKSAAEEDLEFHQIILEATDNLIVEKFCVVLREFFHNKPSKFNYEADKATIQDHERIYTCLKNKNKAEAIEALRKHFEPVYDKEYIKNIKSNIYI